MSTNARWPFCESRSANQGTSSAATPRNYEIWYAYATGYQPSLIEDQRERCMQKRGLSETDLDQIYETYLSPAGYERIDKVGTQVMGEIEQVMAMIDAAAGSANSYTESLADMSEKLGNSKDRDGLRTIVESLVQTAKEMEESNAEAGRRLNDLKQESTSSGKSEVVAPRA